MSADELKNMKLFLEFTVDDCVDMKKLDEALDKSITHYDNAAIHSMSIDDDEPFYTCTMTGIDSGEILPLLLALDERGIAPTITAISYANSGLTPGAGSKKERPRSDSTENVGTLTKPAIS